MPWNQGYFKGAPTYNPKLFFSSPQKSENTSNIVIFGTFISPIQYVFGLFFSRNTKRVHTDQSVSQVFYSFWKETTDKPSKAATSKNFFSSV